MKRTRLLWLVGGSLFAAGTLGLGAALLGRTPDAAPAPPGQPTRVASPVTRPAPSARMSPSAPPATSAARPPAASSADEPVADLFYDESGAPTRELMRHALEGALAEYFPGIKLSPDEMERLVDASFRLREARRELHTLPASPEHAERRRALRAEVAAAGADFADLVDMTPSEFTDRAQPGVGLDADAPDDELPEPEYLEDLPPR